MTFQRAFFVIYAEDFLQPVPAAACLVWRVVKRSGISG